MANSERNISEVLLLVDGDDLLVEGTVTRIGKFTVASLGITVDGRKIRAEGVSKCGNGDLRCEIMGDDIAIGRCLTAIIKKFNHEHIQNNYMG